MLTLTRLAEGPRAGIVLAAKATEGTSTELKRMFWEHFGLRAGFNVRSCAHDTDASERVRIAKESK
jgi:hypothetical protein